MFKFVFISIAYLLHISPFYSADSNLKCGDWDAFKDEKCFKVLNDQEFRNYEEAKKTCYQLEGSDLVEIHTQEEQEFLLNLLHNIHKVVNDVWIGVQYKGKSLIFSDNTTTNYTKWSMNEPKNESSNECVQMSMYTDLLGKWFTEPCSKKNLVVCQKPQNWLYSYLQKTVIEIRENLTNEINSIKKDYLQKTDSLKNELELTKSLLVKKTSESAPSGAIAFFATTSAPFGWLKANGQSVSRITYSNLFATIGTTFGSGDGSTTFVLPDLRSEFIRGWNDGRDVDKDRKFGSFQWGSIVYYAGRINKISDSIMGNAHTDNWSFSGATYDDGFEHDVPSGSTRNGVTLQATVAGYNIVTTGYGNITDWNLLKGSRPRNIALLACIKY